MAVIMTNVLYLTISLALVGMVGRALSRSGRAFLGAVPGGPAEAVSRLLVVAFYLLSLGFIALTLQVWSHVGSAAEGLRLVSVKTGELLLVLSVLHVLGMVVFGRLRHARPWPAQAGQGVAGEGMAGPGDPGSPGSGRLAATGTAGPADCPPGGGPRAASPALRRPEPERAVH